MQGSEGESSSPRAQGRPQEREEQGVRRAEYNNRRMAGMMSALLLLLRRCVGCELVSRPWTFCFKDVLRRLRRKHVFVLNKGK